MKQRNTQEMENLRKEKGKGKRVQNFTSIVVVLEATNDMCKTRNPKTLKEKARFKTAANPTVL